MGTGNTSLMPSLHVNYKVNGRDEARLTPAQNVTRHSHLRLSAPGLLNTPRGSNRAVLLLSGHFLSVNKLSVNIGRRPNSSPLLSSSRAREKVRFSPLPLVFCRAALGRSDNLSAYWEVFTWSLPQLKNLTTPVWCVFPSLRASCRVAKLVPSRS
ncbi:hypothetical protein RRG08_016832 [Elysia crispata]|uniref:Uncharacterized protein n=1 Tax=Elysia crispata TaxID=231223 RepID=A0AAE1DCE1_9GAST|nr:hypothetical protein RRG08_016832 [Elysia crispata]